MKVFPLTRMKHELKKQGMFCIKRVRPGRWQDAWNVYEGRKEADIYDRALARKYPSGLLGTIYKAFGWDEPEVSKDSIDEIKEIGRKYGNVS